MADQMVTITQRWLNRNYIGVSGYDEIPENGQTGWSTMYALTKALQHELGITALSNSFGNETARRYREYGELTVGFEADNQKDKNILTILQGAMYCKGYDPGAFDNGVFSIYMRDNIARLQSDAGLSIQDGKVYDYIFKAFLTMDAYRLTANGDEITRLIQQLLNRDYFQTSGVQPTDGHYQRGTNRALIYGLQTEIGIPPGQQTGAMGPATRAGLPTLTEGQSSIFVRLFQYALHFNGFESNAFTNYFNTALKNKILEFQSFVNLPQSGKIDKQTWLSALVSTGDPDRRGTACDCITTITPARAQTLKNNGYSIVGRYLTNARTGSLDKKIKEGELQTIFNAGLKVFPIYQTYGGDASYFNRRQGSSDAVDAYIAAEKYGFNEGTTIYFAVDFDVLGHEITNNILPHFAAIKSEFNSMGGKYRIGIYGPRAVGIRTHEAGYAEYTFVSGMSTGFSGNLGYPLPQNWSYDQISTITIGSGEGSITIDNNISSGRDQGQSSVEPQEQLDNLDYPLALTYIDDVRRQVSPIVDGGKNWFQQFLEIGIIPPDFYLRTAEDAVERAIDYDALITRIARKLQMRKSFIQTVLAWESSVENILDTAKDLAVIEGAANDSSTGPCQIFAATAIRARGWASYNGYLDEEILDPNNPAHLRVIWEALHTNPVYNIETAGWVLKWGAVSLLGLGINMLNYTEEEIKATLSRYNGTSDAALEYGERNYEIYQAFENYNELSRTGK